MADRFWVGGSGNWDATSTANWASSSGGLAGASAPTSADDVYFDAASNVGTGAFTVTVTGTSASPAACKSFTTGGAGGALDGAMTLTMGATAQLDSFGSMTLPATNLSISGTTGALIQFKATTSQTLTTNGVSLGNVSVTVDGVGGTLTLGSALTCSLLTVTNGTFSTSTSNYALTVSDSLRSINTNVRTINLNASAVTASVNGTAINFSTSTNLTFNAGTSTITCSGTNPTFAGGGQTFYNVTFSSTGGGTTAITGANTYNNLTQTSIGSTGNRAVSLSANQTVNGALTLGAANTAIQRVRITSDSIGIQRTITLNGTLATLADVDFRDIKVAGTAATPWTGTRLGDCKNNSGITFDTPKTVYWNLSGSQNWTAIGWATTNNGVPDVNNFPLAQDTATFTEAGAAGTISYTLNWAIGSLQMADGVSNRTTAFTLAVGANLPQIYGNVTLFSNLIFTGTGALTFLGQGVTQTFTSAGLTLTQPITISNINGTLQLQDNLTLGSTLTTTLTSGTLNLNNNTLSTGIFSSSNSNTRSIAFGTGSITLTGNAATIWDVTSATGFSYTGTPTVNSTYSGSTGTRTLTQGSTGGSEATSVNINITAGTDTVLLIDLWKSVVLTGFAGTFSNSSRVIYGNLTISTGMTLSAGSSATNFRGTSGIQAITTNGKTLDFPVTFNGVGGTFQLQDNLTVGSTRTVTLTNGTLDLTGNSGNWTLSTGLFASSNSNTRAIAFGTGNITLTGNAATLWNSIIANNLTMTGSRTVNSTYAGSTGTRNFYIGTTSGGNENNAIDLNITGGTDSLDMGTYLRNVNFTGFAGTLTEARSKVFYGNLILAPGMTLLGSSSTGFTFAGTSGIQQITTNGKTLDFIVEFNGVGGTFRFEDNFAIGATRAFTLVNGTVNANDKNITIGTFVLSSGTKTLTLGSGTWTVAGTSWNANTNVTGLTVSASTGTISMTSASAKTFSGGGQTWPTLNQGGAGALTIQQSNTFYDITATAGGIPSTVSLTSGTTQTVTQFTLSGSASGQITLNSTSAGSQATLSDASGTNNVSYLTIQDINATGGATWNAYYANGNLRQTNVTGFNWVYISPYNVYTLGAVGFTEAIRIRGRINISVYGSFVGTVTLQRSMDAVTWTTVDTYTSPEERFGHEPELIYYRVGFPTGGYTSGTAYVRIGRESKAYY